MVTEMSSYRTLKMEPLLLWEQHHTHRLWGATRARKHRTPLLEPCPHATPPPSLHRAQHSQPTPDPTSTAPSTASPPPTPPRPTQPAHPTHLHRAQHSQPNTASPPPTPPPTPPPAFAPLLDAQPTIRVVDGDVRKHEVVAVLVRVAAGTMNSQTHDRVKHRGGRARRRHTRQPAADSPVGRKG